MKLELLLSDIQRRPDSYGMKGGYREYVAFLNGANSALDGMLLTGFSAHLAAKLGAGQNLYWALLVAQGALAPRAINDLDEIRQWEEGGVIDLLFRELSEFVGQRT
ncbi:hypothetical protein [Streptomyces sp. NPDC002324]